MLPCLHLAACPLPRDLLLALALVGLLVALPPLVAWTFLLGWASLLSALTSPLPTAPTLVKAPVQHRWDLCLLQHNSTRTV